MDLLIEMRIGCATADVMVHDVFEGGLAAVVHVRPRLRDVAECGRFERAQIRCIFRLRVPAGVRKISVGIGADTDVVEFVVGEKRILLSDYVAHAAVALLPIEE